MSESYLCEPCERSSSVSLMGVSPGREGQSLSHRRIRRICMSSAKNDSTTPLESFHVRRTTSHRQYEYVSSPIYRDQPV